MRFCSLGSTGRRIRLLAGTLFAAVILGFLPSEVWAQERSTGTITGRVVDASSGKPLPKTTVVLLRKGDSTVVEGTVTGAEGRFRLAGVPVETYVLRISYVGYETHRRSDFRPSPGGTTDLGTIRLARTTARQEAVEVTADRPVARFKTDRNVYNISERALSAGGTARTALENLPSIRVDMDGSISFRGNESVSLYINGDPAPLQGQSLISYLESIPASAVQKVETIPNPSAKYEPEGMAGIINIVLRRNLNAGWNGGVTIGAERSANDRYGGNGSVNVGYQSGGWRFQTTYAYRREGEESSDFRLVEQFTDDGPNSWIRQTSTQEEQERSHSLTPNLKYNFTENTSLSLETTLSLRSSDEEGRNEYRKYLGGEPTAENRQDRYVRLTESTSSDETIDGRLDFEHNFSENHFLSTQVRYDRDLESQNGTYTVYGLGPSGRRSEPRSRETETTSEDEQTGSLKVDYSRPLGPLSLETGYKGTLRRLDNTQTFEGTTNAFVYDQTIHAAYGILSKGLGDFQLKAGLRTELVNTTIDRAEEAGATENDYASFYPSAFLTYKPGPRRQARLSYSKRVDRPSLWDINPLESNETPTFREIGNPNLDPEYIHSFELSVTQRWNVGSLTVTPYLRRTVNAIEQVRTQRTTASGKTVIVEQARNLASSTSYGSELVATFNLGDRIEGTLSANVYRSVTDGSNLTTDLSNDAILFSSRANLRGKLPGGLRLEVGQFYRPAREIPPQGRIGSFTSTEVGLRKNVFGGNGSLSLRVEDLLNNTTMDMWYRDEEMYQRSRSQWGTREVSLTFQYTFGSGDSNRERERRGGDEYR